MTAKPTPGQLRRAVIARLKASLIVPQNTSIRTPQQGKQKPGTGVFASV